MNNLAIDKTSKTTLKEDWEELKNTIPNIRIRDAAKRLRVSEAALLATTLGENCIKLEGDWTELLKRLPELGDVMSLTRNDGCVLEHKGKFEKVNIHGHGKESIGTVIGPIETRVFFKNWHIAFAVRQIHKERKLTSLQVFDREGEAVTKVYLQEKSNSDAFEKLVRDFTAKNQDADLMLSSNYVETYEKNTNFDSLLEGWSKLKDTHAFFGLLKKHKTKRYDAMIAAEGRFTQPVNPASVKYLVEKAAETKLPIMIFAGNYGNLQIHQDNIRTVRMLESGEALWLNILDPQFNMHLRQDLIAKAWIVKKPTKDGTVTSLEFYDANENLMVQFFGLRKPGQHQMTEWENLVSDIAKSY